MDKIETIFEALKLLDIKPTPNNVSIMNGVYNGLKQIYAEMEGTNNAGSGTENGTAADSDGRGND